VHDAGAPLPQRYWMELDRVMDRISWYLRDDERLELVFNGELPDPYGATFVDVFEVTRR
jgi:hypothetical protein